MIVAFKPNCPEFCSHTYAEHTGSSQGEIMKCDKCGEGSPKLTDRVTSDWLKLNYPEEIKRNDVTLEKIRGSGAKVA